jgi:hypothetical protein
MASTMHAQLSRRSKNSNHKLVCNSTNLQRKTPNKKASASAVAADAVRPLVVVPRVRRRAQVTASCQRSASSLKSFLSAVAIALRVSRQANHYQMSLSSRSSSQRGHRQPKTLAERGAVRKGKVKILGDGELTKKLTSFQDVWFQAVHAQRLKRPAVHRGLTNEFIFTENSLSSSQTQDCVTASSLCLVRSQSSAFLRLSRSLG